MNIFHLDKNPKICAEYHCDKHVVKMILEYAQILCTVHHLCNSSPNPKLYKPAFKNHPDTIWARATTGNYCWLYLLFRHLCKEYTYRYNKVHITEKKLLEILNIIPDQIKIGNITRLPQCMFDDVKHKNEIIAYHQFYNIYKRPFCTWTNREKPYFFKNISENNELKQDS